MQSKKIIILLVLFALSCSKSGIKSGKSKNEVYLSNDWVKVVCKKLDDGSVAQYFYARNKENTFQEIISSYQPDFSATANIETARIYDSSISSKRYLLSEVQSTIELSKEDNSIILSGKKDGIDFEQKITIEPGAENVHIEVNCTFPDTVNQIDYLLSTYEYNHNKPPYFVHTPGLKFDNEESKQNRFDIVDSQDQVIGDRSYHSPAIILQEGALFGALVPDLNVINESRVVSPDARRKNRIHKNMFGVDEVPELFTLPTALDLNVNSGISEKPIFSFGYMDAIISHHIRYNRVNDSSMVRTFNGKKLRYAFDLIVSASANNYSKYTDVGKLIWEKYGQVEFQKGVHLAMPFAEYHRIIDSITFSPSQYKDIDIPLEGYENTGSWLQWEDENGTKMGGYRSAINWWNDKLHNSQFWNNAREASGFWFWGKKLNSPQDIERGRRIINWCLSAPQNEQGLFATLYNANEKTWALQFSDPMHGKPRFFLEKSDSYDIANMSKTGAHLLNYYLNCEQDERIVDYLKPYGNWLLSAIDERGAVPAYVSKEMEESDILKYSAHPAASLWFLAELYNSTKNKKYLEGAEKIAKYLSNEIIPEAKWIDFEQFYSCGNRPLFFQRDIVQNQIARGSLCVTWAAEAFAALHKATGSEHYLRTGEACVDYLSFFQCSWNPHYIYTAYPFGGVSVDNSDSGTYLDARQADCVKPFIYFGKQLGRQDLLERAVAAARSSIVLINHPRHKSNGIYEHTNIYPYGLGPENIDHEAHPQSAMRTHPSWGEGSGIYTGLAEAMYGLEGVYVDGDKKLAVGVDGLRIKSALFGENQAEIQVECCIGTQYLKEPWNKSYKTNLFVTGKMKHIIVNGMKKIIDGEKIALEVFPDGKIVFGRES
ncbi:MAG: hypothetical protein GQ525_02140 [Draconibacterium sp.]|nr:hypothetical protein [Draconibacterium sp.]